MLKIHSTDKTDCLNSLASIYVFIYVFIYVKYITVFSFAVKAKVISANFRSSRQLVISRMNYQ